MKASYQINQIKSIRGISVKFKFKFCNFQESTLFKKLFTVEIWNIGSTSNPKKLIETGIWSDYTWLLEPNFYTFYADPVSIHKTGISKSLFYEKYSFLTSKGHICSLDLKSGTVAQHDKIELKQNSHHLSYPFVINDGDGELLLIPECGESGCTTVYKQRNNNWTPAFKLQLDFAAIDPTLFKCDSNWFLFCTDQTSPKSNLRLFYTKNLQDSWVEHPDSPILVSSDGARPAGKICKIDGSMYRFGQDNSGGYGDAVNIYRIDKLTTNNYAETLLRQIISPDSIYSKGPHTILVHQDQLFFDAKKIKVTPLAPIFKLIKLARNKRTSIRVKAHQ